MLLYSLIVVSKGGIDLTDGRYETPGIWNMLYRLHPLKRYQCTCKYVRALRKYNTYKSWHFFCTAMIIDFDFVKMKGKAVDLFMLNTSFDFIKLFQAVPPYICRVQAVWLRLDPLERLLPELLCRGHAGNRS